MGSMIRLVSWVSFLCIATWPASVESRSASSLFDVAELTRIVGGVEVSISFSETRTYILYISTWQCEVPSHRSFAHLVLNTALNQLSSGTRRTIPLRRFYDQGWSTLLWWITYRKRCSANSGVSFCRIDAIPNYMQLSFLRY